MIEQRDCLYWSLYPLQNLLLPGIYITRLPNHLIKGSGWHSSNLMISGKSTGFCFSNIFTQMFWFQELIQKSTPILTLMWKLVGAGISIYHSLQLSTYFTILIITIDTITIRVSYCTSSAFPSIHIHPNSLHTRTSVIVIIAISGVITTSWPAIMSLTAIWLMNELILFWETFS